MATELSVFNMCKLSEEGAELNIIAPNGEKTEWVITLRGADSKEFRTAQQAVRKRFLNKTSKLDSEELDRMSNMSLAACVITWSGVNMNGEEFKPTKENIEIVLNEPAWLWAKEQIDRFVVDRANFIRDSGKN